MKLALSPLQKAIHQLEQSLYFCNSDLAKQNPDIAFQFRSAAIQAFEYNYELAWKMLKRYLEMSEPSASEADTLSFPDLIRTGSEKGLLLNDLSIWKTYRYARSITSHTYDDKKAAEVYALIPQFLKDVQFLYSQLEERARQL